LYEDEERSLEERAHEKAKELEKEKLDRIPHESHDPPKEKMFEE